MKFSSLVLLSGGIDSCLAFLIAQKESFVKLAITFDYGQKAYSKEFAAAKKICELYGVSHQVFSLQVLKDLSQSNALQDGEKKIPQLLHNQLDDPHITQQSAKSVWVPNRNGLFLNLAASFAEAQNIDKIYVGFNREEAQTFPDNSKDFLQAVNHSLQYSTLKKVQIESPTIELDKIQIVEQLIKNDFDLNLVWSCYLNQEKMCGLCEPCMRLKRALTSNKQNERIKDLFLS